MKLTSYIYYGPQSSVTLRVENEEIEVSFFPNNLVNLPADHDYTRMLLAKKRLTLSSPGVKAVKLDVKTTDTKVKEVK